MGKKNNAHGNFLLQAQPRWKKKIMLITILSMSLCNVLYLVTELFKRTVKQIKQQSSYSNILFFRDVLQHPYDSWIMNNLNLVSRF